MQSKRRYCWNTDVFLAWLKGEPDRVDKIDSVVREVERGEAVIFFSVITRTELFEGHLDALTREKLKLLTGRPDVAEVNVDPAVADLARELREYCRGRKENLKTPDAQHLATAILHRADEFHTFDEKLLRYNGSLAGYTLKICIPESKQPLLPLR